jgi:hypothetical protein
MRVDAGIDRCALRDLSTDAAVCADGVDRDSARIVVGHQQMTPGSIAGEVNGA